MRILDLKDLELVAGADPYVFPELSDEARAIMTQEQIDEWYAFEWQKYSEWLANPAAGDRWEDYQWMEKHGDGTW